MANHLKKKTVGASSNNRHGNIRRRLLATCLICFSTVWASWLLFAHLNTAATPKPRDQSTTAPAATSEAGKPVYVVENTVFGRRVRLVSPGSANSTVNAGQTAQR